MNDEKTRRTIAAAFERFSRRFEEPRALLIDEESRGELQKALDRAHGQLLGPSEPVLTVALAGGTGVGKSTLINALAGKMIAEASEIRPTTRHINVYHHRDDSLGTLSDELANEANFVAHDRAELRHKMLVDAPDLDSFVIQHRVTTKALLRRSGLVLYVFSPERYLEERTWSVLRGETEFSACAAVLNKSDRAGSPDELEQICKDLRKNFASLGLPDIRLFRVCARAHVPGRDGTLPESGAEVDDMAALRSYIEHELHGSEIAKILRTQRQAVVARLRAEVERVAPESVLRLLEQLSNEVESRALKSANELSTALSEVLLSVEAELAPLATVRGHQRFWGPFRAWLAVADFVSFGLARILRKNLGRESTNSGSAVERILAKVATPIVAEMLQSEAHRFQSRLYSQNLPIERWRQITSKLDGSRTVAEIAEQIEIDFDLSSTQLSQQGGGVVWLASTLGGVIPSALVVIGLMVMTRDLFVGNYTGLSLLWHLLAMSVLFFLALQGLVAVVLPGGSRWIGPSIGPRAVHQVIRRTILAWVSEYREELQADVVDLRESVALIEGTAIKPEAITAPQPGTSKNSLSPIRI